MVSPPLFYCRFRDLDFFVFCVQFSFPYCLSVTAKWLAVKTASEVTYTVSGGALKSTQSNPVQSNGASLPQMCAVSQSANFSLLVLNRFYRFFSANGDVIWRWFWAAESCILDYLSQISSRRLVLKPRMCCRMIHNSIPFKRIFYSPEQ